VTGGGSISSPRRTRAGPARCLQALAMPHYRAPRSTSARGCLALIPRLIIAPTDSGLRGFGKQRVDPYRAGGPA
jgi:hypothetical protein